MFNPPHGMRLGMERVSGIRRPRHAAFLGSDRFMTSIYVGNLSFSATEDEIRELFEQHGTVLSVKLINDRETGRPRGFGFVEMDPSAAAVAIEKLNGKELGGRTLRINEAQARTGGGGGFGGGGGGGGGGYGGGGGGGYGGGGRPPRMR